MSLLVKCPPPAAGHTQVGTDCGEIVAKTGGTVARPVRSNAPLNGRTYPAPVG